MDKLLQSYKAKLKISSGNKSIAKFCVFHYWSSALDALVINELKRVKMPLFITLPCGIFVALRRLSQKEYYEDCVL